MLDPRLHQQAVNHDFDGVILSLVEIDQRLVVEADQFPVNPRPGIAVLDQRLHLFLEFALAPADDRRHHHDSIFRTQRHHPLHNLVGGLPADRAPALGTMRHSDGSEQQAKIIVDLSDRADGRPRAAAGGLLLDRDGWAKSINCIDIRAFHLIQKLPRVGRKSLHVAALSLSINRVEGQRRLPRPAQSGNHRQRVTRNLNVDVLEIVLPGAADGNLGNRHHSPGFMPLP